MATFFGEVVAAPSRAGVDDEEELAGEREETPEDREIRRELEKKSSPICHGCFEFYSYPPEYLQTSYPGDICRFYKHTLHYPSH
uniref:Uncharacterized protein n=1 Tax=Chelonoidis abingdonii TaxID=106734 RepID=A0A8C0J767_CHEAB